MKKIFIAIFAMLISFLIVSPNCYASVAIDNTEAFMEEIEDTRNKIKEHQTDSVWEMTFTDLFLTVGDYAHDFLNRLFGEEITIDKIIYNEVDLLNANFFTNSKNAAKQGDPGIRDFRSAINKWYSWFRTIAVIALVIGIVVVGIKIMLKTARGLEEAKELTQKIFMGFLLVFLFPFVMRYTFDINQSVITYIKRNISGVDEDSTKGTSIDSTVSDLQMEDLEFRSPEYIASLNKRVSAGSDEATQISVNRLENYIENMDIMRIMRAMAGVTLRFVYVIFWYIMMFQTYMLIFIYLKRFIKIAFLIAIYPITAIGYVTGLFGGKASTAFNNWCGNFFSAVLLQTFHAIIYGVISQVIISQIKNDMLEDLSGLNWLLMIVAISFIFTGEKIIKRFWSLATDTKADRDKALNFFRFKKRA